MASSTGVQAPIARPGRRMWPIIAAAVIIVVAVVGVFAYVYLLRNGTSTFVCDPAKEGSCTVTVSGAGASFPFFIWQNWTRVYGNLYPNVTVSYNSIGSTAGKKVIANQTQDFGASDAPLTDAELAASPGEVLFPETLGGVAVTYNVVGIPITTHLNFTGDVVAAMYNGTIAYWDNPVLASLQSSSVAAMLPHTQINAVHRSDGSGTTYAFKDFLAAASPWFHSHYPVDTTANWPCMGAGCTPSYNVQAAAANGNSGVASAVLATDGSVGYVDVIYAYKNLIGTGAVQNRNNNFIQPTLQAIVYAAANETVIPTPVCSNCPVDLRQHIVYARGPVSYPISTYTYTIVYKEMSTNAHTTKNAAYAMAKFFRWIITPQGQSYSPPLFYAELPSNIVAADLILLKSLTWAGQAVITS